MFSKYYLGVRLIFDFVWTTPELWVHPSLSVDLFTPFHSSDVPDKQMNWIVVTHVITSVQYLRLAVNVLRYLFFTQVTKVMLTGSVGFQKVSPNTRIPHSVSSLNIQSAGWGMWGLCLSCVSVWLIIKIFKAVPNDQSSIRGHGHLWRFTILYWQGNFALFIIKMKKYFSNNME